MKKLIRKWLEIKDPPKKLEYDEDLKDAVARLESELSFWKSWFKNRQPTKKCTVCRESIDLWPFNKTEGYYIKGNRVTHQKCDDIEKMAHDSGFANSDEALMSAFKEPSTTDILERRITNAKENN